MAEKDDFNLDDFNYDDFNDDFNFDDGFDTGGVDNDRSVVSNFATFSKNSLKEKVKTPSFYARLLKAAAPSKFSAIFDIGESVARSSEALYNKAIEDATPVGKLLGKQLRKALPSARGLMSEKMYASLDEALAEEESYVPPSKEQQTEDAIAEAMGEFSERQEKMERVRHSEEQKRFSFSQRAEALRHGELALISKTIARNQKRAIAFNEKVLFKIHRKSLEVQFRSLFAIRDLTELNREGQRLMIEQLKVISKHTGLPDAIKLQNSELFKQMMRESLFSRIQSNFGGGITDVIDRISESITKKTSETISEIASSIGQVVDMADMVDPDMAYQAGADMAVDSATDQVGGFAGKVLGKNRKVKRWIDNKGARIARNTAEFGNEAAEWLRMNPDSLDNKDKRWWKGSTDFNGVDENGNPIEMGTFGKVGGWLAKMIRDVGSDAVTFKDDLSIKDPTAWMGKQSLFTNKVSLAITDVIPGLLSLQLSEMVHARTGKPGEVLRYDYANGKYITDKENKGNVLRRLRESVSPGYVRRQSDDALDDIDGRKELSEETRKHLRTQLLINSYQHKTLDPKNFSDSSQFHSSIPEEQRKIIMEFFKKNYSTDDTRNNRFKDARIAKAKASYSELSRFIPSILDELQAQYLAGNGNLLLEIGAMKKQGNTLVFNPDYVLDLINTNHIGDDDIQTQAKVKNAFTDAIFTAAKSVKSKYDEYSDKAADVVAKKMEEHGIYDKINTFMNDAGGAASDLTRRADVMARWNIRKAKRALKQYKEDGWKKTITDKFAKLRTENTKRAEDIYAKFNSFVTDKTFRDEVTGEAIKKLEDLKGNIVDSEGNLLITKEDLMKKIDEMLEKPGFAQEALDNAETNVTKAKDVAKKKLDELGITDAYNKASDVVNDKRKEYEGLTFKEALTKGKEDAKGFFSRIKNQIMDKISKGQALTQQELAAATAMQDMEMENPSAMLSGSKGNVNVAPGAGGNFQSPDVVDRLDQLIKLTETGNGFLEAIATKQISEIIQQGGVDPKLIEAALKSRNPGFLRSLGTVGLKFGSALGTAAKAMAWTSWQTAKIGGGAIKLGGQMALDTAGWMWGGTKRALGFYSDVYVRGDKVPALDAKGLQKGIYEDLKTNKRVKTYKDITGPVINLETGKIALTQEEFDRGLYDHSGKPIVGNILRKFGQIYGAMLTPVALAAKAFAKTTRMVYGVVFNNPDVYTLDDLTAPKLYAKLMENDQYFSKSTSKPIRSFKDIDGEVMDVNGNVCLSLGDLRRGICDYRGKPLKTNIERFLINPAKAVMRGAVSAVVGTFKMGYGILKSLGRGALNLFSGIKKGFFDGKNDEVKITAMAGLQTNEILLQILQLLDDRMPGRKVKGDVDGDGLREGSVEDIRKNRQAQKEDKEQAAEEKKESGFMSKMKGIFGGLFSGDKDKGEEGVEGEEGGDTYIGGDFSRDGAEKDDKKGKKSRRGRGGARRTPPGMSAAGKGGWWQKTKGFFTRGFGSKALGTLGRFGKRTAAAGAMVGTGLLIGGPVGTALLAGASILSAPIVVGALAVGTVGYLGYQAYKWFSGGSDWEKLLYAHYGFKDITGEHKEALDILHADMEKSFKASDESGNAQISKDTLLDAADALNIQGDRDFTSFMKWVANRVRPVFIRLKAALHTFSPKLKLIDADDLPDQQMLAFLRKTEYKPDVQEMYTTNPFPVDHDKIAYIRDVVTMQSAYISKLSKEVAKEADKMKGDAEQIGMANLAMDIDGNEKTTLAGGAKKGAVVGVGFTAGALAVNDVKRKLDNGGVSGSAVRAEAKMATLDKIRYFCYGLKELDPLKVATLQQMEEGLAMTVKFGRGGKPTIGGSAKDFLEMYSSAFGIKLDDPKATTQWTDWFYKRFLRVFFVFVGEVHSRTKATADFFERARKLSLSNMGAIGSAMVNATDSGWFGKSIWSVTASPWPGYSLLNDSKGPLNLSLDLLSGVDKQETASKYAKESATVDTAKMETSAKTTADTTSSSNSRPTTSSTTGSNAGSSMQTPASSAQSSVSRVSSGSPTAMSKPGGSPQAVGAPSPHGKYSGLKEGQRVSGKMPVGNYIMPTTGVVSSSFKDRKHPKTGKVRKHAGTDIANKRGTEIYAVNDGVVVAMGTARELGNYIYINHPDGYQSRYLHLNSFHSLIKLRGEVTKGQLIGTMGMTGGTSTGDHLHFSIVKGHAVENRSVTFIDPAEFYDMQAKSMVSTAVEEDADGGDVAAAGSAALANTAPSSIAAPKAPTGGNAATTQPAKQALVDKAIADTMTSTAKVPAGKGQGGPTEEVANVASNYTQEKMKRINQENSMMTDSLKQAVTHLGSIDSNIKEMVGLLKGSAGGASSPNATSNKPPRTAMANVVNLSR